MRLKYLCSSYSTALTQSEISDDGPFAVYGATGIVGYLSNYSSANEYLSVIKDGAGVGRITYCNPKTSLLGTMAYIIPNEKANINWLKYVLISLDLGKSVSKTTIPHIYFSDYGNREIPYVNRISQQKIADFLDCKCDALDSVLARTRASIEEYKKLKQAVITQAVTKGIRGKRPMKESGVEWIGVLPTDWSVTALKYCASLQAGITLGKKYPKGTELIEVPYLRVANVQGDHVDISDVATIQVTAEEIEKYALHDGELLMTEGGDRDKLGRGTVWHGEIVPCIHQNHVFAVETDESKLLVRFFDYVTSAAPARTYFDLTAKKTTNLACTNSTTILSYRFALPPIAEQQEIVEYLDSKCVELDALIAKKEQYLVELENYKKSLIYEYVTGKKEVPNYGV